MTTSRKSERMIGLGRIMRFIWTLAAALTPLAASAQAAVEYGGVTSNVPGRAGAGMKVPTPAVATPMPAGSADMDPRGQRAGRVPAEPMRLETREEVPMCTTEVPASDPVRIIVGKSTLFRLPSPIVRRTLGDEGVVQARLLSPQVLYLLGIRTGTTNMILQDTEGRCNIIDIIARLDPDLLNEQLKTLFPNERVQVRQAAESIVLSGTISDAVRLDQILTVAQAYARNQNRSLVMPVSAPGGGTAVNVGRADTRERVAAAGANVINLLSVAAPQQVMLEVKVAEVSKTLLDQFGINFARAYSPADGSLIRFLSGFFGGESVVAGHVGGTVGGTVGGGGAGSTTNDRFTSGTTAPAGSASFGGGTTTIPIAPGKNTTSLGINAQKKDGLVKILAEPTVMAISGQEGSFLAGGKIFIPVSRGTSGGGTAIDLEEKEFGVSLKFTPTVLGDGRINLKVNPEVSELNPGGVGITAPGITGLAILPSFTTRRAATTVQLYDGQSFAIGGLIKNNVTSNINAFPILGELPVIGALFRSSDFQTDRSELVFVITPRLVKQLPPNYSLPTDSYVPPTRTEFFLEGKMEGGGPQAAPAPAPAPPKPRAGETQDIAPPRSNPAGGFQLQ